MAFLAVVLAIAVIVIAFETWLLVHLRRQSDEIDARVAATERRIATAKLARNARQFGPEGVRPGLPPRSLLNDCELPLLRGGMMTFSQWKGRRIAVILVQPDCSHSQRLIESLAGRKSTDEGSDIQLIFVSTGEIERNIELFAGVPRDVPIALQQETELARVWRVPVSPGAYIIDAGGVSETGVLRGCREIFEALEIDASAEHSRTTPLIPKVFPFPRALKLGTPAPITEFAMHPHGTFTAIGRTMIVFSDAGCAPCLAFAPALESSARRLSDGLRFVVISRASDAANRAFVEQIAPTYPISLQTDGKIGRAFGIVDTPAAVLVEDGVIASEPAVGAAAITALIERTIAGSTAALVKDKM